MPVRTIERGLSAAQIEKFHEDGFLVVDDVFDEDRLNAVAEEVTAVIDGETENLVAAGELSSSFAEYPFTTRLAKITAETTKVYWRIISGQLSLPSFFELIRTPKLLDLMESLCGPEIIASSVYRLRPKTPGYDHGVVPWHQDSGYFEPYCDQSLIVTCWLPLVDATAENGCLQVLRGGHKGPVVQHVKEPLYLSIPEEHLPAGEIITVPVKRGSVLLLTNRTPHCSTPNNSEVVRWSMDLRYQAANLPSNAAFTRLPDEQVSPAAPAACYPPEADFLVRSQRRPHEVIQDAHEFDRLRRTHAYDGVVDRWAI